MNRLRSIIYFGISFSIFFFSLKVLANTSESCDLISTSVKNKSFELMESKASLSFENGSLQFIEIPVDTIIDLCEGWYSYPQPVATSDCAQIEITEDQIEIPFTDCAIGYTIERIFTATDGCGNEVSASQFLYFRDVTPPTIEINEADYPYLFIPCTAEFDPYFNVNWNIYDNCSSFQEIDISWEMTSEQGCGAEHLDKYIYTVTDVCGNSSIDSLIVQYYDWNPPHLGSFLMLGANGDIIANVNLDLTDEYPFADADIYVTDISAGDIYIDVIDDCGGGTYQLTSSIINQVFASYAYTFCDFCGHCADISIVLNFPAVYGCTDPAACNFNPEANFDDYNCDYSSSISFSNFPSDVEIECSDYETYQVPTPQVVASGDCTDTELTMEQEIVADYFCPGIFSVLNTFTITNGCCTPVSRTQQVIVIDTIPPIITGDTDVMVSELNEIFVIAEDLCSWLSSLEYQDEEIIPNVFERTYTAMDCGGNISTFTQIVTLIVPGCLNPNACNFNPDATVSDEDLCIFSGCTDPEACNYDPNATCESLESCLYPWGDVGIYLDYDPNLFFGIEMELISAGNTDTIFTVVSQAINDEEPVVFLEVPVGTYFLRAKPDANSWPEVSNFCGVYVDSGYYWLDSTPFEIECGQYYSFNIGIIELQESNGEGTISGKVFNAGVSAEPDWGGGTPMADVPVILIDTENTMENLDLSIPVGYVLTDELGSYEFDQIPPGNYSIVVDIPGLSMDESYNHHITSNEYFIDQNFYAVTDDAIYSYNLVSVAEITKNIQFEIYPNPFNHRITIECKNSFDCLLRSWWLTDVLGNTVQKGNCESSNCIIDGTSLSNGFYYLKLHNNNNNQVEVFKVVKQG